MNEDVNALLAEIAKRIACQAQGLTVTDAAPGGVEYLNGTLELVRVAMLIIPQTEAK